MSAAVTVPCADTRSCRVWIDLLHAQLSSLQFKLFAMTCIAVQVQRQSGSTITHEVAMPGMLSGMQYRAPRPSKHPPSYIMTKHWKESPYSTVSHWLLAYICRVYNRLR